MLVAAVWVLQRHPGEDWWATSLLTYGPQVQWIAPPALALIVTLAARRGFLSLLNLAALAMALFFIAGFQLNAPISAPEDAQTLRVATWNVYGRTRDVEMVESRLRSWEPDVVCLQESALRTFDGLLPESESAHVADLRTYVRGTITNVETPTIGLHAPRRMLVVEAETAAGPVTIINVHIPRALEFDGTPRELELLAQYMQEGVAIRDNKFDHILDLLPEAGPAILAGDMNTPPASRFWRRTSEHLTDAFDAAGRGFGHTFIWRRHLSLLRIDYIWTGGGIRPLHCWIEPARPSDHRPVIADLQMP